MNEKSMKAFVTIADGSFIRVKLLDDSFAKELFNLGFLFDDDSAEYVLLVDDHSLKAKAFEKLRDLGVSFSDGKEWCPSEVFEYLRKMGLLSGQFQKVSWRAPRDYHLTTI